MTCCLNYTKWILEMRFIGKQIISDCFHLIYDNLSMEIRSWPFRLQSIYFIYGMLFNQALYFEIDLLRIEMAYTYGYTFLFFNPVFFVLCDKYYYEQLLILSLNFIKFHMCQIVFIFDGLFMKWFLLCHIDTFQLFSNVYKIVSNDFDTCIE